jgi:hypothetical protein
MNSQNIANNSYEYQYHTQILKDFIMRLPQTAGDTIPPLRVRIDILNVPMLGILSLKEFDCSICVGYLPN